VVLAFPTNQFGHQENSNGEEILNALKHVRPGNGFEPKCVVFDKVLANGEGTHPVFTWLKSELPTPSDDSESMMGDPKFVSTYKFSACITQFSFVKATQLLEQSLNS